MSNIIAFKPKEKAGQIETGEDDEDELQEEDEGEWRPSMNLFELIQCIPKFIQETIGKNSQLKAQSEQEMVGKFYLGLHYDYQQIWMQNQSQGAAGVLSA